MSGLPACSGLDVDFWTVWLFIIVFWCDVWGQTFLIAAVMKHLGKNKNSLQNSSLRLSWRVAAQYVHNCLLLTVLITIGWLKGFKNIRLHLIRNVTHWGFIRMKRLLVFQSKSADVTHLPPAPQAPKPRTAASLRWRSFPSLRTSRSATSPATPSRSAGTWKRAARSVSRTTSSTWTRRRTRTQTSSSTRCHNTIEFLRGVLCGWGCSEKRRR